jgi:hypothetical protein
MDILRKKFEFKALKMPTVKEFISTMDFATLEANWDQQLRHQLPVLPTAMSYFDELRESALLWMEARQIIERLPRLTMGAGESAVPRAPFPQMEHARLSRTVSVGRGAVGHHGALDQIRYAARNRLCAEIRYHGVTRVVEPYSLRIKGTGNLLLYVHEILRGGASSGTTKAYKVPEIETAHITERSFHPRYVVEL